MNSNEIKFSIVITTCNRLPMLKRAIESALGQTVPCEVVVADDGSTDGTEEYCRSLGSRIVYFRNSANQGKGSVMNSGVAIASGKWIKPLDDDDFLFPNCIETIARAAALHPQAGICSFHVEVVNERGSRIGKTKISFRSAEEMFFIPQEDIHYAMFMEFISIGVTSQVAFKREAFLRGGGWNASFKGAVACDDAEAWSAIAQYGDCLFVNKTLAYYTVWPGGCNRRYTFSERMERNYDVKKKIATMVSSSQIKYLPPLQTIRAYLKLYWAALAIRNGRVFQGLKIALPAIFTLPAYAILFGAVAVRNFGYQDPRIRRIGLAPLRPPGKSMGREAKKILLVSNYVADQQISMQMFASMLAKGLADRRHDVRVVRPEPVLCRSKNSTAGFFKWLGYIDKLILFPSTLRQVVRWADVVHICDHSNAVYVKRINNKPHLITCNDLLAVRSALGEFPQNPTGWTGRVLQRWILSGLKQAGRICCISDATRADLLRIGDIPESVTSVLYMGMNYDYKPMTKPVAREHLERLKIKGPFFIHVGKDNWYKNRAGAVEIFSKVFQKKDFVEHQMIFAGAPFSGPMQKVISAQKVKGKIHALTGLSCEDLRALYSLADALIYPSIAEGFGWPIIEAQACGCPVFTSNRAPMTEAGGDAAVYFDPEKPEDAARVIAEALSDNAKIEEMRRKGFENIKRFSTDKMIDEYLRVYEEILERSRAHRAGSRPQAAGHRPQAA